MEEDTGKTTHLGGTGRIHGADRSLVDYNRSGVPLVEIVSGPDIRSSEQARLYASELRGILIATGASDGRMEEGSMRIDANVSIRKANAPFGTRCEIKNLNSLRSLQRAIDYEALRQIELVEAGGDVRQETRHWDEDLGVTYTMRTKEEAEDYRYFREPDLVDLIPDEAWQERVRAGLPLMPAERRTVLLERIENPTSAQRDAVTVVVDLGLESFVHAAVEAGADPGIALARVANEVAAWSTGHDKLSPEAFSQTVLMEQRGELSSTQAKTVLGELLEHGGEPAAIASAKGFEQMSADSLATLVTDLLDAHPDEWQRYRDGDEKLAQFFIGLAMKATKGQANGKDVIAQLQTRR
jgi:aspartyl-tRNA(Asn)/glutamyl-tRNA(Gln) amidotransferase subunit B